MINLIDKLGSIVVQIISSAGYAGVFFLSMLESAAIPIPSEVVVPFSGFLAVSGRFNLWLVIIIATLANLVGSIILYYIGKSGGRWILERYGKYVLITKNDLEIGDRWFNKYGIRAIFWGRMLPIVRTFVSLGAGVSNMNFYRFSVVTFLGSLPWNAALAIIGYKAGEKWSVLHAYFRKADIFIVIFIVVLFAAYIWRHLKKR